MIPLGGQPLESPFGESVGAAGRERIEAFKLRRGAPIGNGGRLCEKRRAKIRRGTAARSRFRKERLSRNSL
jgi:hypothetical protein